MSSSLVVCRNTESAVIKVRTSEAWTVVRQLNFASLMPSSVKACSLLVPESAGTLASSHFENTRVTFEDTHYKPVKLDDHSMSPFMCGAAVGSLRHVTYKDGAEFVFRIVEMSDVQHLVAYELIETDATVNVSSVLHTIQLFEVTETGETFVSWTTEFSGDCDQHVFSDAKFKKLDAFKDFKKLFSN
jgi:hypothetical protein